MCFDVMTDTSFTGSRVTAFIAVKELDFRSIWYNPVSNKIQVKKLVNGEWVEYDSFENIDEFDTFMFGGMQFRHMFSEVKHMEEIDQYLTEMIKKYKTPIPAVFLDAFEEET